MHPGVKLRHIRAFLDIAAEGGLSAVARAQGITQPALSRTIARLEAALGGALFERDPSGSRLTALGEHVASRGEAILAAAASLLAFRYLPENSHVVVGALAGGATGLLWKEHARES